VITVIRRPLGHKLDDTQQTGTIGDSAGDALVTTLSNHGLSDGDYVYVESNFESYNGFKYVDSVSYTTFKLKESEDGDYVPYKQDADITFYISILNHGWQCVHLPIVYELESSLFPNNTEEEDYNPITIVGQASSNGYTQLQFSGAISDPTVYAKIDLVGTGPLAGVYQILTVVNNWTVVIDLAYSASNSFTGYLVVKYYDNYAINVNIYAGLYSGHRWEDEKPMVLAATKRMIPDNNNRVLFSIDEILKGYIKTVNNLTLDTMPNNIDFLVEFYIGYYESYDISDGEEITRFDNTEFMDTFIGQAVNAKNEFKNIHSGHLSDYIANDGNLARWLTDFDRPIAVVGYYFDLSFLFPFNGVDAVITINKRSGMSVIAEVKTIVNPGKGVLRVEITPESGFDEYCIVASTPGQSGLSAPMSIPDLSTWLSLAGSGIDESAEPWTTGPNPEVTITVLLPFTHKTEYLYAPYTFLDGYDYTITLNYQAHHLDGSIEEPHSGRIIIMDSLFNILFSQSTDANLVVGGTTDEVATISFTANSECAYIGFDYSTENNINLTVMSVSGTEQLTDIEAQDITEQICIDIIEECGDTFNDQARLTEPGELRILE
jgi:hypothetical protein